MLITLDLDDRLIGADVVALVHDAFARLGVDMLAGGLMRVDKTLPALADGCAPSYDVDFAAPRANRGGRVWSHLRAAPKYLYDAVPLRSLHAAAQTGAADRHFYQVATDWALMLPISDMAWRVAQPTRALYLYEPARAREKRQRMSLEQQQQQEQEQQQQPGVARNDEARRAEREAVIADVMSHPPLARRVPTVAIIGDASHRREAATATTTAAGSANAALAEALGEVLTAAGYQVLCGGMGGIMEAASRGAARARQRGAPGLVPLGSEASLSVGQLCDLHPAVGVLPNDQDPAAANAWSTPLRTGIGTQSRNALLVTASDAVVVVGGGEGTQQEVSSAWALGRLVVTMRGSGGTADATALRQRLGERDRLGRGSMAARMRVPDVVHVAGNAADALDILQRFLHNHRRPIHKLHAMPSDRACL